MAVEVVVPKDFVGTVVGDLTSRRGRIGGMEARGATTEVVSAQVPLSEMFGYATSVRSATQGRRPSRCSSTRTRRSRARSPRTSARRWRGRVISRQRRGVPPDPRPGPPAAGGAACGGAGRPQRTGAAALADGALRAGPPRQRARAPGPASLTFDGSRSSGLQGASRGPSGAALRRSAHPNRPSTKTPCAATTAGARAGRRSTAGRPCPPRSGGLRRSSRRSRGRRASRSAEARAGGRRSVSSLLLSSSGFVLTKSRTLAGSRSFRSSVPSSPWP